MKKVFTILGIFTVSTLTFAQVNLFNGSDFNTWSSFTSSLDSNGLKYAVQGVGTGIGGTDCLNINSSTSSNAYVFTANTTIDATKITSITMKVKGTSGGISFNVTTTAGVKYFNVPVGTTADVTLSATGANAYTGTINATDWITITLDLTGLTASQTGILSVKVQKSSTPNLLVDDIKALGNNLATTESNKSKINLVKNTIVENELVFGQKTNAKLYNSSGQLIKVMSVDKDSKLDVSSLPKGNYIITAKLNGEKISQKIIKK